MKKLLVFIAFIFLAFSIQVKAQFILGGNIGFSAQKHTSENPANQSDATLTSITVIPRLAYQVKDNWVGLDVGLTSLKIDEQNTDEDKLDLFSISPFYRFIKKPADHFGIWLEAQAGGTFGNEKLGGTEISKFSGFNVGIRPGVIFYIGERLSFEASFGRLGYTKTTITSSSNSDYKESTSKFGLSLNNNNVDQLVNALLLQDEVTLLLPLTSGFLFGANWAF